MAYLLLYGNGWTQRWRISDDREDVVRSALSGVGTDRVAELPIQDPGTDREVSLVVAWSMVAAAALLESAPEVAEGQRGGLYP